MILHDTVLADFRLNDLWHGWKQYANDSLGMEGGGAAEQGRMGQQHASATRAH